MINLLPKEVKRTLKRSYHLRLFALFAATVFLSEIILGIIFGSLYVLLAVEKKDLENLRDVGVSGEEGKKYEEDLARLKQRLETLSFLDERVPVSSFFGTALRHRVDGISVSEFVYQTQETKGQVSIRGASKTRESFLDFLENVKEDKTFLSVDSPISNLEKSKDFPFVLTLTVDVTKESK